jgi:hypothetical protein
MFQELVDEWKKDFYKNIENRNITADFEMVDGQPLRIEHDFTGIPTNDDSQQNGNQFCLQLCFFL